MRDFLFQDMRCFRSFILVFLVFFLSCSFRHNKNSDSEKIERKLSLSDEISFGNYLNEIIMSRYLLYPDPEVQEAVASIGKKLVAVSPTKNLPYRFEVLISIEPNSFSAPGGYVYITTGLLDILGSKCEVAAAIAREIGHIYYGDHIKMYREEMKRKGSSEIFSSILKIAKSRLPGAQVKGARILISSVTSIVVRKGYTKKMEMRADGFGVKLLRKAGYDPKCMLSYMEKLSEANKSILRGGLMGSSRKYLKERLERLEEEFQEQS